VSKKKKKNAQYYSVNVSRDTSIKLPSKMELLHKQSYGNEIVFTYKQWLLYSTESWCPSFHKGKSYFL